MATRDRTNLYISYRQSYSHHPAKKTKYSSNGFSSSSNADPYSESRGLMSPSAFDDDDGDAIIEMSILPPRWADISDEVADMLADIALQSSKLDKLHQKHVLPGFDDDAEKKKEEREIEQLTQGVTRGFHECQRAISGIDNMVKEAQRDGTISAAEEKMAQNIKINLASRVQEASAGFRKKQSAYLKKLRGMSGLANPERTGTPTISSSNPYLSDISLQETALDESYSSAALQTQSHVSTLDPQILQREREIEDIAKGILDLAGIFKELQTMVIDQGTMLDRIDYNVEQMGQSVKGADKELVVASGYQKKGNRRKLMLLLILLVVGMFIILFTKPLRRNNKRDLQALEDEVRRLMI